MQAISPWLLASTLAALALPGTPASTARATAWATFDAWTRTAHAWQDFVQLQGPDQVAQACLKALRDGTRDISVVAALLALLDAGLPAFDAVWLAPSTNAGASALTTDPQSRVQPLVGFLGQPTLPPDVRIRAADVLIRLLLDEPGAQPTTSQKLEITATAAAGAAGSGVVSGLRSLVTARKDADDAGGQRQRALSAACRGLAAELATAGLWGAIARCATPATAPPLVRLAALNLARRCIGLCCSAVEKTPRFVVVASATSPAVTAACSPGEVLSDAVSAGLLQTLARALPAAAAALPEEWIADAEEALRRQAAGAGAALEAQALALQAVASTHTSSTPQRANASTARATVRGCLLLLLQFCTSFTCASLSGDINPGPVDPAVSAQAADAVACLAPQLMRALHAALLASLQCCEVAPGYAELCTALGPGERAQSCVSRWGLSTAVLAAHSLQALLTLVHSAAAAAEAVAELAASGLGEAAGAAEEAEAKARQGPGSGSASASQTTGAGSASSDAGSTRQSADGAPAPAGSRRGLARSSEASPQGASPPSSPSSFPLPAVAAAPGGSSGATSRQRSRHRLERALAAAGHANRLRDQARRVRDASCAAQLPAALLQLANSTTPAFFPAATPDSVAESEGRQRLNAVAQLTSLSALRLLVEAEDADTDGDLAEGTGGGDEEDSEAAAASTAAATPASALLSSASSVLRAEAAASPGSLRRRAVVHPRARGPADASSQTSAGEAAAAVAHRRPVSVRERLEQVYGARMPTPLPDEGLLPRAALQSPQRAVQGRAQLPALEGPAPIPSVNTNSAARVVSGPTVSPSGSPLPSAGGGSSLLRATLYSPEGQPSAAASHPSPSRGPSAGGLRTVSGQPRGRDGAEGQSGAAAAGSSAGPRTLVYLAGDSAPRPGQGQGNEAEWQADEEADDGLELRAVDGRRVAGEGAAGAGAHASPAAAPGRAPAGGRRGLPRAVPPHLPAAGGPTAPHPSGGAAGQHEEEGEAEAEGDVAAPSSASAIAAVLSASDFLAHPLLSPAARWGGVDRADAQRGAAVPGLAAPTAIALEAPAPLQTSPAAQLPLVAPPQDPQEARLALWSSPDQVAVRQALALSSSLPRLCAAVEGAAAGVEPASRVVGMLGQGQAPQALDRRLAGVLALVWEPALLLGGAVAGGSSAQPFASAAMLAFARRRVAPLLLELAPERAALEQVRRQQGQALFAQVRQRQVQAAAAALLRLCAAKALTLPELASHGELAATMLERERGEAQGRGDGGSVTTAGSGVSDAWASSWRQRQQQQSLAGERTASGLGALLGPAGLGSPGSASGSVGLAGRSAFDEAASTAVSSAASSPPASRSRAAAAPSAAAAPTPDEQARAVAVVEGMGADLVRRLTGVVVLPPEAASRVPPLPAPGQRGQTRQGADADARLLPGSPSSHAPATPLALFPAVEVLLAAGVFDVLDSSRQPPAAGSGPLSACLPPEEMLSLLCVALLAAEALCESLPSGAGASGGCEGSSSPGAALDAAAGGASPAVDVSGLVRCSIALATQLRAGEADGLDSGEAASRSPLGALRRRRRAGPDESGRRRLVLTAWPAIPQSEGATRGKLATFIAAALRRLRDCDTLLSSAASAAHGAWVLPLRWSPFLVARLARLVSSCRSAAPAEGSLAPGAQHLLPAAAAAYALTHVFRALHAERVARDGLTGGDAAAAAAAAVPACAADHRPGPVPTEGASSAPPRAWLQALPHASLAVPLPLQVVDPLGVCEAARLTSAAGDWLDGDAACSHLTPVGASAAAYGSLHHYPASAAVTGAETELVVVGPSVAATRALLAQYGCEAALRGAHEALRDPLGTGVADATCTLAAACISDALTALLATPAEATPRPDGAQPRTTKPLAVPAEPAHPAANVSVLSPLAAALAAAGAVASTSAEAGTASSLQPAGAFAPST